jgi:hypothetical protein
LENTRQVSGRFTIKTTLIFIKYMTTPTQETGLLSVEKIDALKEEHGEVIHHKLKVSETENAHFYTRKYKRAHVESALKTQTNEGSLAGGRVLLDALYVGGDSRVISEEDADVDIRISASLHMAQTVNFLSGEVIKN